MKVVQINATCGQGSTGKICVGISELLNVKNIENYIFYSSGTSDYEFGISYASLYEVKLSALFSRIFGNWGFNSWICTIQLVKKLKQIDPDVIHIHNIHGHNCNLSLLFKYVKRFQKKVIWTFHDCWAFTGYCMHYEAENCDKWKQMCNFCPQRKKYSWFLDLSHVLYKKKKKLFSNIDLTIVTPSKWMANQVQKSFLNNYRTKVIHNGIDLNIFKPCKSDFREKYSISNSKKIVLGVAFDWSQKKGLDIFIKMASELNEEYQVVLVGTNSEIDRLLPSNVISIHRTQNQYELAEIYSAANVFVNPTREDTFPTVNIEAIACGTPVITFDTGGSPEIIDEKSGIIVEKDDLMSMFEAIRYLCSEKEKMDINCIDRSKAFNKSEKFYDYIELYNEVIG